MCCGYNLQPHVVVLAQEEMNDTYVAYACIHSSVFYETATLMEAVDVAFKSSLVLGLKYPAPAHSAWTFMQKAVYALSLRYDRVPSKVFKLMSDLGLERAAIK